MTTIIEKIISNPAYHDYLAILKGARNGLVYGAKVRFPHALVMAILFGRGDWSSRARTIFSATKQHAFNLAKYVTLYKTLLWLQRRANEGKERNADTFFAGMIGGYIVFGDRTPVNEQIVFYVVSRVLASFIPRDSSSNLAKPTTGDVVRPIPPDPHYFSLFAAVTWGLVMWLFRHRRHTIQTGMFNSMTYLYLDSNIWSDLRTLLWHNT
jgi:peroxisomal membrane protein 4